MNGKMVTYCMRNLLLTIFILLLGTYATYAQPKISFFTELGSLDFEQMFSDPELIGSLQQLNAELRVGLIDMDEVSAMTILKLNEANIPLAAWLVLPKEEGYFFHAGNGEKALARYEEFREWTRKYKLQWEAVGIDPEPSLQEIQEAINHPVLASWNAYMRLYDDEMLENAQIAYEKVINAIRQDGYPVESYIFPIIYDERKAGAQSLQKILGILDIKTDKEIAMCYTSGPGAEPAAILNYGKEADGVAIGSTGGGITIDGVALPALDWEAFARDLRLAHHTKKEIHIFSLEGCVKQGFLAQMIDFDFSQPVSLYSKEIQQAESQRVWAERIFRMLDYPLWVSIGLIIGLVLLLFFLYKLIKSGIRAIFGKSKVRHEPHVPAV